MFQAIVQLNFAVRPRLIGTCSSGGGMQARDSLSALFCVLLALITGCGQEGDRVYPVALSDGTYRVAFGKGYSPTDEARVLAVTARLDRTNSRLVFTLTDGSVRTLSFSPRPRGEWQPDCFTMSSHYLEEVAEVEPAPLQLESLTFATPVIFPKCGPQRMILSNATLDESAFLAFDLQ
jgi:hypothetical protein